MHRRPALLLFLLMATAAALQVPYWRWLIEDSAISFAYARNLADGWGLVTYPGHERVEGYSNPTWVALIAVAEFLGAHAFNAGRALGLSFGVALVPAVAALGRRVQAPFLAALIVATSSTAAIWAQSGLENPLLLFLLAVGTWRMALETEEGKWPASALIFALVAMTRPEGFGYGLAAGAVFTAHELFERRALKRALIWWALLVVPLALFEAARIAYFALPLPATYYAKLGKLPPRITNWDLRGWRQVREWLLATGLGPMLPIVFLGLTGAQGWRMKVALGSSVALALTWLLPHVFEPPGFGVIRLVVFGLVTVALSLATIGRPAWTTRLACFGYAVFAVAFTVRSEGDWMSGYRFLSPLVLPAAVLLAAGLGEIVRALRRGANGSWRPWSRAVVGTALLVWVGCNVWMHTHTKRDTSPYGVRKRLNHYYALFERLHLERPFLAVDHDMGGMMWWHDPARGRVIDARGLVDLPFALHQRQAAFVEEYLFEQQTFDLAHAHASTGRALNQIARFEEEYVEVAGYGRPGREHMGNFMRRDLFLRTAWEADAPPVPFGPDVELVGHRIPSPEVAPGTGLFLEVAVRARSSHRLVAFVHGPDGALHSWELPPAYGWIAPEDWREDEIFVGRFALGLPDELPLGDYALGFVVFGPDGEVWPAGSPATPSEATEALVAEASTAVVGDHHAAEDAEDHGSPVRFARGEQVFEGAVTLLEEEEVAARAEALRDEALRLAASDRCSEAELGWEHALRHRTGVRSWRRQMRPEVAREIAGCWARAAAATDGVAAQVRHMEQARRWDIKAPVVLATGAELARALEPTAHAARQARDDEEAFRLFDAVARLDPSRAWARRRAEEARARRLGLELGFGMDDVEDEPESDNL